MKNFSRRSFLHKIGISAGAVSLVASQSSFTNFPIKNQEGKNLNIVLCGLGRYAGYLANSFKESKYCNLAGLITGTPSKAKDWGN